MDEYISRNELLKVIQLNVAEAHNERCAQLLEAIVNAPAADVVPKSEVEDLKDTNEHLAVLLMEAKAEVAREIFEEIEREINDALKNNYTIRVDFEDSDELYHNINGKINALRGIEYFISELKEKYTEDKK